ncbi:MAG: hypothetical protein V4724_37915 [Pseudomonadota bacterium]
MDLPSKPDKETVRNWLRSRRLSKAPPPPIEQIQAELGWTAPAARGQPDARVAASVR